MNAVYEYRTPGRRPSTRLALAAALFVLSAAIVVDAPRVQQVGWLLVVIFAVQHLFWLRVTGCRIGDSEMELFIGGRVTRVELGRVASVHLVETRRGRIRARIEMTDGSHHDLPACCLPPVPTLAATLRRRRIAVRIDRAGRRA